MRIGIDARELCGHATGVGRYLAGLLMQAVSLAQTNDFGGASLRLDAVEKQLVPVKATTTEGGDGAATDFEALRLELRQVRFEAVKGMGELISTLRASGAPLSERVPEGEMADDVPDLGDAASTGRIVLREEVLHSRDKEHPGVPYPRRTRGRDGSVAE